MPASTASTISIACRAPMVGPPPSGTKRRSTFPSAANCTSRSAAWPRSPRWATRIPPNQNTHSVFGPRCVPATSSCSDAIPTTSPIGDSCVPAVDRSTTGSPPIAPTPLWSRCSWVTRSRSAETPSMAGYSQRIPRSRSGERSSKGSMKTVVSPSQSRKADCPYHSSCMLLLCDEDASGRAAAAHGRRGRGDEAGDHREGERRVEPVAERPGDEGGEERVTGHDRLAVRGQRGEHVRVDQVLHRVVAEEGGEQDRHRREGADGLRPGGGGARGPPPPRGRGGGGRGGAPGPPPGGNGR